MDILRLAMVAVILAILSGLGTDANAQIKWQADGVAVCLADSHQQYPRWVRDGGAGAIFAWLDYRNGSAPDIYAQRIDGGGTARWTTDGIVICTGDSVKGEVCIASDGSGGAIIGWYDNRSGPERDIYAQRVDSNGAVQWPLNGLAVCTAVGAQHHVAATGDGTGGAIITWMDKRGSGADIYAQRLDINGVPQWQANGIPVCVASGNQEWTWTSTDGMGGAIMTWRDYRTGPPCDIYAQSVDTGGNVEWTPNGVEVCLADSHQDRPKVIHDGTGGAIVIWKDNRNGPSDLYAQRIDSSGTSRWTTDGITICTGDWTVYYPSIASDGAGGAVFGWCDDRNPVDWDIYSQRVDSGGIAQWQSNGLPICTAIGDQFTIQVVGDGTGGAIFSWTDYRTGESDIYAQWVNAGGTPQWSVDGISICAASGSQGEPEWYRIGADDAGDAIIVWHDYRNGINNADIYAQRVTNVVGVQEEREATIVDHDVNPHLQVYPNPCLGIARIQYQLPTSGVADLRVYDISGRLVHTLAEGQRAAGTHIETWHAANITSGIYFCRLQAGDFTETKKMVLLR